MNNKQAKEILKAKLECLKNTTSHTPCNRDCDNCELNYKQGNIGEQKEALKLAINSLNENKENNMKILMCPKCGASTLGITEKGNYLCLKCNHKFNTETTEGSVKNITFEIIKKKTLKFPKFESNAPHSMCLIPDHSTLCCNNISCGECIFLLRNYIEFINSKEGE